MFKTVFKLLLPALLILALALGHSQAASPPLIAAASDLREVLPRIVAQFEQDTGQKVKLTFGSTGNLSRQIKAGAPYEILLAADHRYVRSLIETHQAREPAVHYATGSLALFVPKGSAVKTDPALADLVDASRDGRLQHLAIANPDHAPYGRAAQETLQRLGLYRRNSKHLVLAENAMQAMQFALAGGVDAALVPYVLARSNAAHGHVVKVPSHLYTPLHQSMVLLPNASSAAQQFFHYMQQGKARAMLSAAGFTLPPTTR